MKGQRIMNWLQQGEAIYLGQAILETVFKKV